MFIIHKNNGPINTWSHSNFKTSFKIMLFDTTTWCLLALATLTYIFWHYTKQRRLPKGPIAWPIIGDVNIFIPTKTDNSGSKRIWRLSRKLKSDIISLKFWNKEAIVLHKYADIKSAYTDEAFQHRTDVFFTTEVAPAITGNEGPIWREHKQTFQKFLCKLVINGKLECIIHTELDKLIQHIKNQNGKPIDPCKPLIYTCGNVISQILLGQTWDYDDQYLMENTHTMISNAQYVIGWGLLPITRYIPGDFFRYKRVKVAVDTVNSIFRDRYETILTQWQHGDDNCYIEAFIETMRSTKRADLEYTEERLLKNMNDFMVPAATLISAILRWGIICMIHHPDIQKKVRNEIHNNIPIEQLPRSSDRHKLPYTEATLTEIMRSNIVQPISTIQCSADHVTNFQGYELGPRTVVMANWYAVHNDPTHWDKPEVFNPDRFLDENNCFKRDEHFAPFSMGKRQCAGIQLSHTELFLVFATLMQQFEITPIEGTELPSLEPLLGSAAQEPQPHKACFMSQI